MQRFLTAHGSFRRHAGRGLDARLLPPHRLRRPGGRPWRRTGPDRPTRHAALAAGPHGRRGRGPRCRRPWDWTKWLPHAQLPGTMRRRRHQAAVRRRPRRTRNPPGRPAGRPPPLQPGRPAAAGPAAPRGRPGRRHGPPGLRLLPPPRDSQGVTVVEVVPGNSTNRAAACPYRSTPPASVWNPPSPSTRASRTPSPSNAPTRSPAARPAADRGHRRRRAAARQPRLHRSARPRRPRLGRHRAHLAAPRAGRTPPGADRRRRGRPAGACSTSRRPRRTAWARTACASAPPAPASRELLRTLVLGLAVTHPPETLNFVLADFKGGATFAGMAALPHVAAVITNLATT